MVDLNPAYLRGIQGFEGFTPRAAWDYKQNSNGYGTRAAYPGEVIDRATANERLDSELTKALSYVDSRFPNLPENKRAALGSLTFNAGPGWMNSGLGQAVGSGNWEEAARRFAQYNKAGGSVNQGLANRRFEELGWFNGEDGPPSPRTMAYAPETNSPPERQRGNPMAYQQPDQGSLTSQVIAGGPGALFGAPSPNYNWADRLQKVAAWGMAQEHPGILETVSKPREDYAVVNGPDGSVYRVNKKTGEVTSVAGPQGKVVQTGEDMAGNKIFHQQIGNKFFPITSQGATGQAGADAGAGSGVPLLAPGVTQFDDSLTGADRLAQFHPDIRAGIENYINGTTMPTGRGDKYRDFIKRQAQRIGADMGIDVSDAAFAGKRTALTDLAKASPSTAGGQAITGLTTLEHLDEVKRGYDALHNRGLAGVPLIGSIPGTDTVSRGYNAITNSAANQADKLGPLNLAKTRVAEESSKYYASGAPAQTERNRINDLYSPSLQPAASDALIKQEKQLISDKVRSAISQLASTLGENHPRVVELKARLDAALAKVDKAFAPAPAVTPTAGPRILKIEPAQ